MTPDRYARICDLFDEAEKLAPPERHGFLRRVCGDDTDLLVQVEEMLAHAPPRDTALFEHTPPPVNGKSALAGVQPQTPPGKRIGPYEIRGEIGSGGMGSVYLAVRVDDYHQQVAIKLLKGGLATDDLVQRFRTERQVLAGLNHPNIGRLLDGGTTADRLPYFVMEYVEGEPIDRHCNARQLSVRQRAELLLAVCEGVEHAHRQTVVHRDLKPGNVLVTADGTPKILDFGLAKRLAPDATADGSGHTQTGAILGTPSYMAPEQAGGRTGEAGPAADVWALGAILYELLTGRPPFRADTPLDTVMQVLREEPVAPSRLHPKLPRDLETICLKCLQKDPKKRYTGAAALADDLRRFLNHEPIQARPVGRFGRLWRWGRRNPRVAGLLAALVFVLVAGFAAVTALWLLAERRGEDLRRQTAEAERQRDRAEKNFNRVFDAIEKSLTQVSKSKELRTPEMLALRKRLLAEALEQFRRFVAELGDNPRAKEALAKSHLRIADIHHQMGTPAQAVADAEKGVALLRELVAEEPASERYRNLLALMLEHLARVQPDPARAGAAHQECLGLREALLREYPARAAAYRSELAFSYFNKGRDLGGRDPHEALRWLANARAIREEEARGKAGRDNLEHLATTCGLMAAIKNHVGRTAEAVATARRAVEVLARLGREHPDEGQLQVDLAQGYEDLNRYLDRAGKRKEAAAAQKEACAVLERLVARDVSPGANIFNFQTALARSYYNLALDQRADFGTWREAKRAFAKCRGVCEKLLAVKPAAARLLSWHGLSCYNLAELTKLSDVAAAVPLLREACDSLAKVARLEPDNLENRRELSQVLHTLAHSPALRGKREEAVELLRRAVDEQRRAYDGDKRQPADAAELAERYRRLAHVLRALKRPAGAVEATLERGKLVGGNAARRCEVAQDLARCVPLVGADLSSLTAAQQAERNRYVELALAELRAAVAAGYRDAERLQEDEVWEPLRGHAGFQRLVLEAGRKVK